MEDQDPKSRDESVKIVVFRLGNEEFGVDISQVNRIIKMDAITRVPNTPPYILGVLNLRGGIIVIVDLAMKLGFPSKRFDRNTRIIDIEISNTIVGMVVDSATELLTIQRSSIQPAPSMIIKKVNGDYLTGVTILDQRILILLDLTKVLNTDEMAGIGSLKNAVEPKKSQAVVHPIISPRAVADQEDVLPVREPAVEAIDAGLAHHRHAGDFPQHPF